MTLRDDINTVSGDLAALENRSVVEDKFYVKRRRFDVGDGESCYDPFTVDGGNVLDFAANFTLRPLEDVQSS